MEQTLDLMDQKLKSDHTRIRKNIDEGTIKVVDLASKSPDDKLMIQTIESPLGSYLLHQSKATIYKGDKQLTEVLEEESPPEAELDGTMSNIFNFLEVGGSGLIFHGGIRTELRKN
jgi:hypothetical protein